MKRIFIVLVALFLAAPALGQNASMTLEVLSEGDGEKTALRYNLADVQPHAVQMDVDTTMGMGMGGQIFNQSLPTIRTIAGIENPELNADGHLAFDMVTGQMQVVDNPNITADPTVAAAMETALSQIGEIRGRMVMDDRGNIISSDFDTESITQPEVRQMVESSMQSAQQSVVPFPETALGVGAQWRATMEVSASGMTISQSATYELTSLEDGIARISSTISQTADAQALDIAELPPGASAELVSHTGTGSSTMAVNLNTLMPTGNMTMNSESAMRYDMGAAPMDMGMTLGLVMRIESAE